MRTRARAMRVFRYNLALDNVITRLGLKPDTTREAVLDGLARFGVDDSLYGLLNVFPVRAWESWTIPTHVVHAPGPWLTFEIQVRVRVYGRHGGLIPVTQRL